MKARTPGPEQLARYRLTPKGEAAIADHPPVTLRRGRRARVIGRDGWVLTDRGRAALDQHPT